MRRLLATKFSNAQFSNGKLIETKLAMLSLAMAHSPGFHTNLGPPVNTYNLGPKSTQNSQILQFVAQGPPYPSHSHDEKHNHHSRVRVDAAVAYTVSGPSSAGVCVCVCVCVCASLLCSQTFCNGRVEVRLHSS